MDIAPISAWHLPRAQKPILIAGPCSAETEEQVMDTAKQLAKNGIKIYRAGIWKPRTKPGGFEGVGEIGLPWLQKVVSENYRSGLAVVPILLLANLCVGVYWNLSIWFKLTGQTKFGAGITIFGAIITLVINFVGIPKFGYMACAWATLIAYGTMMVTSYILGQKYYPIKYNLRSIFVFTFLALGFYFISTLYSEMGNIYVKLLLNNILLGLFAFIFYKLEFDNLNKLKHLEV